MLNAVLIASAAAALVAFLGFGSRWLNSHANQNHWSGWAATASLATAAFLFVLAQELAR